MRFLTSERGHRTIHSDNARMVRALSLNNSSVINLLALDGISPELSEKKIKEDRPETHATVPPIVPPMQRIAIIIQYDLAIPNSAIETDIPRVPTMTTGFLP